jgi:hypothetical protein
MGVRTARRVCSRDSMVGDRSVGGGLLRGYFIEKYLGEGRLVYRCLLWSRNGLAAKGRD